MVPESILESRQGTIKIIRFNKPHKKNAIDSDMYRQIKNIFEEAIKDESISIVVLTGTGDFYSSGNDFSPSIESNDFDTLKEFINSFVTFPKLLVAVVNGPAIGVAATTLALCDLVFASENSYFLTPFTKLGMVAEGCSTISFPKLIGDRKAAEMLYLNHKMSAKEALSCGFVNYIYKPDIESKVWDRIIEVSKLPSHSLYATKKLLRCKYKQELLEANEREMEELSKIWSSGDHLTDIANMFTRKSKI